MKCKTLKQKKVFDCSIGRIVICILCFDAMACGLAVLRLANFSCYWRRSIYNDLNRLRCFYFRTKLVDHVMWCNRFNFNWKIASFNTLSTFSKTLKFFPMHLCCSKIKPLSEIEYKSILLF